MKWTARKIWLPRFGLRTLMVAMCVVCVWLGIHVNRARQQAIAVRRVKDVYGTVLYDYHVSGDRIDGGAPSPFPTWLVDGLGTDLFHAVVWLDLDSPAVRDKHLHLLRTLCNVEHLYISNTSITDDGLTELSNLPKLKALELNTADLSDAALVHVGKLQSLHWLRIYGANITDEGLEHLHGLRRLELLELDQERVTDAGIAKLRAALPQCDIDIYQRLQAIQAGGEE